MTPIFKKDDSLNKENYRPDKILTHLPKMFEMILYKKIDSFKENKFSPYNAALAKISRRYSLLEMIENWKYN